MPTTSRKKPSRASTRADRQTSRRATGRVRFAFPYLLALPEGYATRRRRRWPLLVFFHGRGERGQDLALVKVHGPPKLIAAGQTFPFIVVSPQCSDDDYWWNYVTLAAFVDDIVRRFRVDRDRVYLTGLSMGGFATWALAQNAPGRYAAIAPICGGGDPRFAERLRDTPVWAFHGAKDPTIPAQRTREMIKGIRAAGGAPRLTIYPNAGHDSWTKTYENPQLYAWLLSHRRRRPRPST